MNDFSSAHSPTQPCRSAAQRAVKSGGPTGLSDNRLASTRLAQLSAVMNPPGSSPDRTGLPPALRAGVERLSGRSLAHVRVHRNSSKPAQLNAHAYAQGGDIHLAPGQEKHLPHEAWHVAQQAQGRVRATTQAKGIAINDDTHLEREADVMGAKAAQMKLSAPTAHPRGAGTSATHGFIAQRVINTAIGTTPAAAMPAVPFIGLPNARKSFNHITATTSAADPPGMGTWRARGYLGDPSKGNHQALTRMHAIRGKFGGPSAGNNMFLGTALSNNFNPQSHYSLVEQPLENYIKSAPPGEKRAVDYHVTPAAGVPPYMALRIPTQVAPADVGPFTAWANVHVPNGFMCTAFLYRQVGPAPGPIFVSGPRTQHVATDVGATIAAAVTPGVAPGVSAGVMGGVRGAGLGMLAGAGAAYLLSGPIGWAALGLGAVGALYGYATAEND